MRNQLRLTRTGLLIAAAVVFASMIAVSRGTAAPDARAAAEKALRDTDSEWSKAASARDLDRTVFYYADSATLLPPNAPVATSKEAIRREWAQLLNGSSLSWHATKVELSRGGELGYTIGAYEGTFPSPNGKSFKDQGKYLEVWKKQADGKWKCVADMYSSDLPMPSSQ
jgi:ketosteroid isomerase-like protein